MPRNSNTPRVEFPDKLYSTVLSTSIAKLELDNGVLTYTPTDGSIQTPLPVVDLASAQTITGLKTIQNELKFKNTSVNNSWKIIADEYSELSIARFDNNGSRTSGLFFANNILHPLSNNSYDLGDSARKFKNLYIAGMLTDGTNSYTLSDLKTVLDSKQSTLTFDSTPTASSTNPVTSNGIYQAIKNAISGVYLYKGSYTVSAINSMDPTTFVSGWVFNVEDAGTITLGSSSITVSAGDNVAWDGSKFDKLASTVDLSGYVTTSALNTALVDYVTRTELQSDYYTKTYLNSALNAKQDSLVSGTSIKTINNTSILGSGDISIPTVTVDSVLSNVSENPVQNKVVYSALSSKANESDCLTSLNGSTSNYDAKGNLNMGECYILSVGQIQAKTAATDWSWIVNGSGTSLQTALNAKQDSLVSGTSIKTINGTSLLGSGDISVLTSVAFNDLTTKPSFNGSSMSSSSAIWAPITSGSDNTQLLKSNGTGQAPTWISIKTINNESLLGAGNIDIQGGGTTTILYDHIIDCTAYSYYTQESKVFQAHVVSISDTDLTNSSVISVPIVAIYGVYNVTDYKPGFPAQGWYSSSMFFDITGDDFQITNIDSDTVTQLQ